MTTPEDLYRLREHGMTLEYAARVITYQRDYCAEHGHYDPTQPNPEAEPDQCFDDWAADCLSQALETLPKTDEPNPPRYESTVIGTLDVDSPGADHYCLLDVHPDDPAPTEDAMHEAFLQSVYNEGRGPGRSFCHCVTVMPVPHCDGMRWIGIAHVRLDV